MSKVTSDAVVANAGASDAVGSVLARPDGPSGHAPHRREPKPMPHYTLGEEIANSVTHGVGVLLSIAGLVLLVVRAVHNGAQPAAMAAAIVFGVSLILEYLMSTLYHAISHPGAKRVLRTFDHSCIYLLIAGSYTPFTLGPLLHDGGVPLMVAVWAFALVGIGVELVTRERQPRWVSIALYLAMGWLVVLRLLQLVASLEPACLWLLVAGGLCYTVGTVFYLLKRVRYMHSVWHVCVMGGSVCMFLAVYLFLLH